MSHPNRLTAAQARDRVALTVDAILSIPYVHSSPVATVHVLIDHLLLLGDHAASVDVTYEGQDPIHTSLPAREFNLAFGTTPGLGPDVDSWSDRGIRLVRRRAVVADDGAPSLSTVFKGLRRRDRRGYHRIFERLDVFLDGLLREGHRPWAPLSHVQDVTEKEAETLFAPFQSRYDDIQHQLAEPGSLFLVPANRPVGEPGASRAPGLVNLFALVRCLPRSPFQRPAGEHGQTYEYDTRLVFTENQRDALRAHGSPTAIESGLPTQSEVPLCPRGSAGYGLLDVALGSGHVFTTDCPHSVDAGGWPFAALVPGASRVAALPVHVGGTAWCCLFTYFDARAWSHLHRVYRDAVPQLAQEIRLAAREAFLDCIERQLRDVLTSSRAWDASVIPHINRAWIRTCLLYPFPVPQLQIAEEQDPRTDESLRIGNQHVLLGLRPSAERPLREEIDYNQLSSEHVLSRCSAMIQRMQQLQLAQLDTVFATSHEIKNALDATKWYPVLDQLVRLREDEPIGPELRDDIRFALERMIWPVSLAAIMRAIAKSDGTDLRDQWLESDAHLFDMKSAVPVYRESVRFLVGYIADIENRHAGDFRLLECDADEIAASCVKDLWEAATPVHAEPLDLSRLQFPPLIGFGRNGKEGENAPFVPASLLAEPLRNAVAATKRDMRIGLRFPLLCWSVRAAAGSIEVELCNAVGPNTKLGPQNVNIALVSRLGSVLNVGTVEPPRSIATADEADFVVVRVRLHPQRLLSNPLVRPEGM